MFLKRTKQTQSKPQVFFNCPPTGYRRDFPFTIIKKAYFIMKNLFHNSIKFKNNKGRMFYFVLLLTTFHRINIYFLI